MTATPRIIGVGHAVPDTVRRNDDPAFAWLRAHETEGSELFYGYEERRVLAEGECLTDIMVPAAQRALDHAGVASDEVDILIGCGSISPNHVPNALSAVHRDLGLSHRVGPIPVMDSFSQFPTSVMIADGLIRAGRGTTALLVFGANWSRYVSYRTSQAVSAGDGAAAVVMRASHDPAQWHMVDQLCDADTGYFGSMAMHPDPLLEMQTLEELGLNDRRVFSHPYFHINETGLQGFTEFGKERSPKVVLELLEKNNVDPSDCCLMTHQASAELMTHWKNKIGPAHYEETLAKFANMVLVSVPFNLSRWIHSGTATQDWLVTLCLGPDMHATAMLFRRGA